MGTNTIWAIRRAEFVQLPHAYRKLMTQQLTHNPELSYVRKAKRAERWHTVSLTTGSIPQKPNNEDKLKNFVSLSCFTVNP